MSAVLQQMKAVKRSPAEGGMQTGAEKPAHPFLSRGGAVNVNGGMAGRFLNGGPGERSDTPPKLLEQQVKDDGAPFGSGTGKVVQTFTEQKWQGSSLQSTE